MPPRRRLPPAGALVARLASSLLVLGLAPAGALAAEYYVDPEKGSMANDGSAARPWRTLEEVAAAELFGAAIRGGDTVWLRSGFHGELDLRNLDNEQPITIAAEPGHTPRLTRVSLRGGRNWRFIGLHVSPEHAEPYDPRTMIEVDSTDVLVESCVLQSVADASGWSAEDWDQLSATGISVGGTRITVRGNRLRNVAFGIVSDATDSLIEHNVVDTFSFDGMRGLGDRTVFQYNVVKNALQVNDNHSDGFQSWSVGPGGVGTGEVVGVVLRGNVFINYEDPNLPFRADMQGIGCFDGTYIDWVVENNVVITNHWHGITLLGARNVRVVNNTVIDREEGQPGPPWISVDDHKDGTPPEGSLVRNNLTTDLANAAQGVTEDHNIIIENLADHFVDPAAFDLHLLPDSPAVNAGTADLAPPIDIEGVARPQGAEVDVGAFEWHDGTAVRDGGLGSFDAGGTPGGEDGGGDGDGGLGDDGGGGGRDAAAGTDGAGGTDRDAGPGGGPGGRDGGDRRDGGGSGANAQGGGCSLAPEGGAAAPGAGAPSLVLLVGGLVAALARVRRAR